MARLPGELLCIACTQVLAGAMQTKMQGNFVCIAFPCMQGNARKCNARKPANQLSDRKTRETASQDILPSLDLFPGAGEKTRGHDGVRGKVLPTNTRSGPARCALAVSALRGEHPYPRRCRPARHPATRPLTANHGCALGQAAARDDDGIRLLAYRSFRHQFPKKVRAVSVTCTTRKGS